MRSIPIIIVINIADNAAGCIAVNRNEIQFLRSAAGDYVDNLHLKSGINPDLLAELHGNMTKLRCPRCGKKVDQSEGEAICGCGGKLVSSVVDFGQSLPEKDLRLSFEHSRKSDLFVVVGSSLAVTPAADMPLEAIRSGAKLVIINQGETPFDHHASLRFNENIGDVLPRAVNMLKKLMGLFE